MWILSLLAACASTPCGGASPAPTSQLEDWPDAPVGEGVVCAADATTLAVDYPGKHTEEQLTTWATTLEGQGWQVVELRDPDKHATDSRWLRGEDNLSLSVRYDSDHRVTTVYLGRY